AVAIPNFISYQLKSKTIEAKTNLAGIKTAELTFSADRSCYLSVQNNGWPGTIPANGAQVPWPDAAAQASPGSLCINPKTGAPARAVGTFGDIGFAPSGQVRYNYHLAASPVRTETPGPVTNGCPSWPSSIGAGPANGPTKGFLAQAVGDLDGDGKLGGFMVS